MMLQNLVKSVRVPNKNIQSVFPSSFYFCSSYLYLYHHHNHNASLAFSTSSLSNMSRRKSALFTTFSTYDLPNSDTHISTNHLERHMNMTTRANTNSTNTSEHKHKHKPQSTIPKVKRKALHVAIVGPPNAGKSQLLNTITKQTISAVSRKRHTTRNGILATHTHTRKIKNKTSPSSSSSSSD
mmetsp:Transcript_20966/g.24293  ORF Transcript_20966/g.24293 Transcript_20966/m.24293 type:complete len:183 (-) Transcript_20966:183-731(-)